MNQHNADNVYTNSRELPQTMNTNSLKVALLTTRSEQGSKGGAEQHYQGLLEGCRAIGCNVTLIEIEADESSFQAILANHRRCAELDLSEFDVVISTKVPTYAIRHPAHVVNLIHTVRVFDDMFSLAFPNPTEEHLMQRAQLHSLELDPLCFAKARFANGKETANRLFRWRGLHAEVIHPPLISNSFRQGSFGNYFFLPGRLHRWKRVDLLIKAVQASDEPLKLIIAGSGEDEKSLHKLASSDSRITFLGRIDDGELIDLYAGALAIPFVPLREDFGYITLEAFASGKPVITCQDSGEPTRLIRHGENGLICAPTPDDIREAMESLFRDPQRAAIMGKAALRQAHAMNTWPEVAKVLIDAACSIVPRSYQTTDRVCALDMQPITPPIGGGRLRLLGLYHNLGLTLPCKYVGTYDWPGEQYRSNHLSETLQEITIPLSESHHSAAASLSREAQGKTVIDLAFSKQAILSPEYLQVTRSELLKSDVVIFSHPWVYPLVKECLHPDQLVIYDSHNVEGLLRAQLLDIENPVEADLLRQVVNDENELGWAADWILTCSHEDMLRFHHYYGFPLGRMRVVPNGVMAFDRNPPSPQRRSQVRETLGISSDAFLAIFVGSPYGPNVEAAEFIVSELADAMPDVAFVIAGGVGDMMRCRPKNVVITGMISEEQKTEWFIASDIGINPMFSGSGTNIKMFDYMSLGLPVVSTSVGSRGIITGGRRAIVLAIPSVSSFQAAIYRLKGNDALRQHMGSEARLCVEEGYAWERISEQLGCFISARRRISGQSQPLFSVVIPTFDRHEKLSQLMSFLKRQIERDFEVVVVDQTPQVWTRHGDSFGFPLTYHHTPVKGAVRARNTGAMIAQGRILAFVDDDCEPSADWLLRARHYFNDQSIVGIEGMVTTSNLDDPSWRPVTNVGFEGLGFMTANLFSRSDAFQFVGGFDLEFDNPHFREDTDLGWSLLRLGKVPYARDVQVFHPPQSRCIPRESNAERDLFFQNDALLYKKHPEMYMRLFFAECHYKKSPGFSHNILEGFRKHEITPPNWILDALQSGDLS